MPLTVEAREDGTVRFSLTRGQYAIVDTVDAGRVLIHKWSASEAERRWYAVSTVDGRTMSLHRFIMDAQPGQLVDHANGDGLDNRRSNLRFGDHSGNARNIPSSVSTNTSGFLGITWSEQRQKWVAQATIQGHSKNIGRFDAAVDAAIAYDEYVRLHDGSEFCRFNFPQAGEMGVDRVRRQ